MPDRTLLTERRDRAPLTASVRRAVRLEHRLTQPNASLADLEAAVTLAVQHDLAALRVNPWLVKAAKRLLGRSRVALGTVVGFPHGGQILSVKAFEASKALEQGATQIDFVLNGGALASGDDETVFNDMLAVIDMAHSALAAVGVIIEAEPMSEELVRRACRLAERAGADHLVTSPGGATARGTVARTRLLRDSVGPRIGIKACGRFRSADLMADAAAAGATRVSAHLTLGLARQMTEAAQPAGSAS
ncbi:MAG: deoxyribose-phosphate aldolase [Candidatus Limnocylindria bacterium]